MPKHIENFSTKYTSISTYRNTYAERDILLVKKKQNVGVFFAITCKMIKVWRALRFNRSLALKKIYIYLTEDRKHQDCRFTIDNRFFFIHKKMKPVFGKRNVMRQRCSTKKLNPFTRGGGSQ